MKATTLPLPTPWTADAAVLHLYRVWSNQGRVYLRQIALLNPNMVNALTVLWQRDHEQEHAVRSCEVASGTLPGVGRWQLLQEPDGTGTIMIEQESGERREQEYS